MAKRTVISLMGRELRLLQGSRNKGKFTVTQCAVQPVPEGCLINGLVTDEDALVGALAALRSAAGGAAKRALLLVDSTQLMTKTLAVPPLKKNELRGVVQAELSALDSAARDLVYDWAPITPAEENGVGETLLCVGIERTLLEQYTALFKKVGIQLEGVTIAQAAAIRAVETLPELAESFILCILQGQTVLTCLFAGGAYLMLSRSRLLTERGSEAVASELIGRISSMRQFSQGQKSHSAAQQVYFAGMDETELKGCRIIADTFGIGVGPVPDSSLVRMQYGTEKDCSVAGWLLEIGALLPGGKKAIDLLAAAKKKAVSAKKKTGISWIAIPVALALAVLGGWGGLFWQNWNMANELKELQAYTQSPDNLAAVQQVNALDGAAAAYQQALTELENAGQVLQKQVEPDNGLFARLYGAAGDAVELSAFTYTGIEDSFSFQCAIAVPENIPDFVRAVRATGDYSAVGYSGYSYDEDKARYIFTVACIIKEG